MEVLESPGLPNVPLFTVLEDGMKEAESLEKEPCTIETTIKCEGHEIPVKSTADDCASAGGAVDDLKDLMGCD